MRWVTGIVGGGSARRGPQPSWLGLAAVALAFLGGAGAQASSTITRSSSWVYDNNTGLVTSETVQPNNAGGNGCINSGSSDPTCVTTAYTYDAYGNKTSVTVSGDGLAARTTQYSYSNSPNPGQFVTSVTNALNQTETWDYKDSPVNPTYNASFGVPFSHTGPNGVETNWWYDSLGRKTVEQRADGTVTNWSYYYGANYSPAYYVEVASSAPVSGNWVQNAPATFTIYDALGRVTQTLQQVYSGSNVVWAFKNTYYNADGQVYATDALPQTSSDILTYYVYDPLGRPLTTLAPCTTTDTNGCSATIGSAGFSTTSYNYNGLTTTVTDPFGNAKATTYNDMGLPKGVTVTSGSNSHYAGVANTTSSYTYDALGELLTAVDPGGNTTSYTYDISGRKTQMVDPDRGTWSYTYDALGETISQTNANGNTTFAYDLLGRLLTENAPDQTDQFTYDTTSYGIGKISTETSLTNGSARPPPGLTNPHTGTVISQRAYTYDNLGRPSVTGLSTYDSGGNFYLFQKTYSNGLLSTVRYPSGYTVQYNYTGLGTLGSLTCTAYCTPGASTTLWTLNTNDAAGQVMQETYGNGVVVNNTYDTSSDRLTNTTAAYGTTTIANFGYVYDQLGNLTQRTSIFGVQETLTYDDLYRLTSSTVAGTNTTSNYAYDLMGDIIYKTGLGSYTYGASGTAVPPHAIKSINGGTNFTYDGNLTSETLPYSNVYAASWMSDNMAYSVTQGTNTYTYAYDANNNRVVQELNSTQVIQYFNDPDTGLESDLIGTTWNDYLSVGGEQIGIHYTETVATQKPCGTTVTECDSYAIRDHLGSIVMLTNNAGAIFESDSYDPWGVARNPTTWASTGAPPSQTTKGYTGHEEIQQIGLINANARLYDPTTGRFFSPDPLINNSTDPQAFNPYSYVENNPLSATDPTGMCGGLFGFIVCPFVHAYEGTVNIVKANPILADINIAAAGAACNVFAPVCAGAAAAVIYGTESGKLGVGLEQGLITGAEVGAFEVVGSYVDPTIGANGAIGPSELETDLATQGTSVAYGINYAAQVSGDGLVGGLASLAEGGSFESGFLAAGFAGAATPFVPNNRFAALAAKSVIGGFSSVLGGGKFANGAETGAFEYLYNQEAASPGGIVGGLEGLGQDALAAGRTALGWVGAVGDLLTLSGDSGPWVLYHYTTAQGMAGILASGQINPSLAANNPNDARYGDGQYFTDISPGTMTSAQLSRTLLGNPFQGSRFTNYVGVNVNGLPVVQGRPNVFVVPNQAPLNIENRLEGAGQN